MKFIVVSMAATVGLIVASSTAMAIDMPDLAKKLNCTLCHDIDRKMIGPAWKEVAKKYHGQTKYTYSGTEYSLTDGLVMKVSKGGSGNWGLMPMPPNDQAGSKKAEMTELVNFIQSLGDK